MPNEEPLDGPTRDLLVRLDERFSMVVGSVREIKDELHALRRDLREGDEALKTELKKEIREKISVLGDRVDAVEKRVENTEKELDIVKQSNAENKGGRDLLSLLISGFSMLIALAALLL